MVCMPFNTTKSIKYLSLVFSPTREMGKECQRLSKILVDLINTGGGFRGYRDRTEKMTDNKDISSHLIDFCFVGSVLHCEFDFIDN